MGLGVERLAPGLGVFDPLIGLSRPAWAYYIALAVGLILNVLFVIVFKSAWLKRQERKNGLVSLDDQPQSTVIAGDTNVSKPAAKGVQATKTLSPDAAKK